MHIVTVVTQMLDHVRLFCDPMNGSLPDPLSMVFLWQEYWSGLPFPSPGDLSDPGIKPMSPFLAGGFFTTELPGKPENEYY